MFARTERLLLRPGWAEDAPALHAAIADERIVCNLASAPWPYRARHAKAFLATERGAGDPSLLVFRRGSGGPELVGTVGIGRRPRPHESDATLETPSGERELGYWIAQPFWGRGYATEAAGALIGIARDALGVRRLTAGHFVDNPASGRVLEKLGFRPTGIVAPRFSAGRGRDAPCRLLALRLDGEEEKAAA